MSRACLFVALLASGSVFATERVRVAVLPIVAPGVDDAKLLKDLNAEVLNILAETDHVTLVTADDVSKRLAEEGGRCPPHGKERTDCLERVALATRAVYSIALTVTRLGKDYEISGAIADSDRVLLEQPESLTVTDSGAVKTDVALKHQLRKMLLENMKVAFLPPDPRMRNPQVAAPNPNPNVAEPPPPVPPLEPAPAGISTMRVASFVAGGVAVVAGLSALVLGLMAKADASGLDVMNGVLQNPDQLGKVNQSRTEATFAAGMGGIAAVAAVGAVMMFVMFPGEEPRATVTPVAFFSAGGGGIGLTGVWP